jgi:GntR family transcriptional regulator
VSPSNKPTGPSAATLIPLYLQISESISREIAAGRYREGDRLPPERELAGQFGTTVRTLRKALAELQRQGMLERIQGSGNYVRNTDVSRGIYSMFRLELTQGGGLPTAVIIEVKEMNKPASLPSFGRSKRATRVRRRRFLDNIEVACEEIWLDRKAGKVDADDLGDSLYRYYQVRLGVWISAAEDRVSVAALPDWAPADFAAHHESAYGYIERLSWAQDKLPVEYSRTWFSPQKARYVQRLK